MYKFLPVLFLCCSCAVTSVNIPTQYGIATVFSLRPYGSTSEGYFMQNKDQTTLTYGAQMQNIDPASLGAILGAALKAAMAVQGVPTP